MSKLNRSGLRMRGIYKMRRRGPTIHLSPRFRFRAFVRKVISNLGWISDLPMKTKSIVDIFDSKDVTEVLLQSDKYLLFKDPSNRDHQELASLANRLSAYKCFRKYSLDLKIVLLKKAKYQAYIRDVVLIRQGMSLDKVYLLCKGKAKAMRYEIVDGNITDSTSAAREGFMFGEHPILYGKQSQSTVITEGPSEWLVFEKKQFLIHAQDSLRKQYSEIEYALRKFSCFDKIAYFELREYCILSYISRIQANTVLKLYDGTVALTYFILEGKCSVLQKLVLLKDPKLKAPGYKLPPSQDTQDPTAEQFIVRACFLTRRGIFGIGEEACRWVIVTETDCIFLVVPRFLLLKHSRNLIWERLKEQLNIAYPTLEVMLQQIIDGRVWAKYKFNLSRSLTRNISGNDIHNVPLTSRCYDLHPDDYGDSIEGLKSIKCSHKVTNIDMKQLELHPYLNRLAQYLPK